MAPHRQPLGVTHDEAQELLDRYGVDRLPASLEGEENLHPWVLRYALKMAQHTAARQRDPAPAPPADLLQQFRSLVEPYPSNTDQFQQGSVDPASSLRRALTVREYVPEGAILCLGDDDATSIALKLVGAQDVTAVDIDERVIRWVRKASRLGRLRVHAEVGDVNDLHLKGKFAAVVTDPPTDLHLARQFLKAARSCLQPGGWLIWADHPDLNPHFPQLLASVADLELVATRENWHSYTPEIYNDRTAAWFGLPQSWFIELASEIRVWSHLLLMRDRRD